MGDCRGERHGGLNTGIRGTRTETVTERAVQQGRHTGVNGEQARQARAGGGQGNLGTISGACTTVPGVLRVGRCRLDLAPTTFTTDGREVLRKHCGGCTRLTWIWESSRIPNSLMVSTPAGRPAIASSRWTRQPTPRRRRNLLPLGATLRGGGGGKVWTQRHWVPARDGGAAVVHSGSVPLPQIHYDYGADQRGDTE